MGRKRGNGLQKAIRKAARLAGLPRRATCHTFRHSFAAHLLKRLTRHPPRNSLGAQRFERHDHAHQFLSHSPTKRLIQAIIRDKAMDTPPTLCPLLQLHRRPELGLNSNEPLGQMLQNPVVQGFLGLQVQPDLDAIAPALNPHLVVNLGLAVPNLNEAPAPPALEISVFSRQRPPSVIGNTLKKIGDTHDWG